MKQKHAQDIYDLYDRFIDEFLFNGNSILTEDENILNEASINNCISFFIDNYNESDESFDKKIVEQFKEADKNTKLVFAHCEWLWAYSVQDIRKEKKMHYTMRTTGLNSNELDLELYPKGFGSAGQWHTNNKYNEIKFNLLIIQFIWKKISLNEIKTSDEAKKWIENICLFLKYGDEFSDYSIPDSFKKKLPDNRLAMTNILPYTGNPDNYERIASDAHKERIFQSFKGLLSEEERNNEKNNLDQKILLIRDILLSKISEPGFDFYDKKFAKVWGHSFSDEGFDKVQGLQYKKAIILYGPLGTSKTYTAKELSKAFITNAYLKDKTNVEEYFNGNKGITEGRIHHLQLHPNYTYEDFIAGYQLKNGETIKTKGTLFAICEEAKKDLKKDIPHVLILDEINRIDLSRLFGEVFSALEDRDNPINLGIEGMELSIPRNLYVIGTMNEIDFSLEQIDFALRRRFLWFFFGFDKEKLKLIIEFKNEKLNTKLKMGEEMDRFLQNASSLNKEISSIPELGKQYQIGHTFFAEIVDIYKSYKEIGGYKSLKNQLFRKSGPVNILWDISIEPMLQSFLGNMENEESTRVLKRLEEIYLK